MSNLIKKILEHPEKIIINLGKRKMLNWMSDEQYLKLLYKATLNKSLNLDNPQTFNEKLQWLKLHNRNPEYTKMVDKYEAKKYVASIIGEEYIIQTLGIYDKFDDIDFDKLPKQFVMKCTHDSGGLVICKDKSTLDIKIARKKINKSLKRNFYYFGREWAYKDVKPRIIIEKYMVDKSNKELKDYKVFCFNGKSKMILVCSERFSSKNMCETFFDIDWNLIPVVENNHPIDKTIPKPLNLEKMLLLANKLSKNIPFLRVDFYEINDKIYFGELTFFPATGLEKFEPSIYDFKLGKLIDINWRS